MQTDFLQYIYQAMRGPKNRFPAPDRRADGLAHGLVRPHVHLDIRLPILNNQDSTNFASTLNQFAHQWRA
jgi:hypothetical protein